MGRFRVGLERKPNVETNAENVRGVAPKCGEQTRQQDTNKTNRRINRVTTKENKELRHMGYPETKAKDRKSRLSESTTENGRIFAATIVPRMVPRDCCVT